MTNLAQLNASTAATADRVIKFNMRILTYNTEAAKNKAFNHEDWHQPM